MVVNIYFLRRINFGRLYMASAITAGSFNRAQCRFCRCGNSNSQHERQQNGKNGKGRKQESKKAC